MKSITNVDGNIELAVVGAGVITIGADGLYFMAEKGRKNAFSIRPRLPGESVWRVVQRAVETLARADEMGEKWDERHRTPAGASGNRLGAET
jgi:hypothetical protein